MSFLIHGAQACAQLDRAFACFERHQDASAYARRLRHQLQWAVTPSGHRLHRIDVESGQVIADLGARCEALERLHDDHRGRRQDAMSTLAACASDLKQNDVDLLWDVQARLSFVARFTDPPSSMIDVLRAADPSFERNEEQKESAINSAGFSVDFLRREETEHGQLAFSISGRDGDVYPVQAPSAQLLLSSPRFDQTVVGANGRMALMRTIDPVTFVQVKRWISDKSDRNVVKRIRDRHQAEVVQALMDAGRLRSKLSAQPA
ncbi:hypothetical protein CDL60_07435 [Roseateles noduli]|nr:hypothetical protein CDL60_07435 [Roseateles noduli]